MKPRSAARLAAVVAFGAALALGACGRTEGKPPFTDPPPLPTTGVTWVNADKPPTIESLKGRVVLLEFGYLH
jgi:hypothetical protein